MARPHDSLFRAVFAHPGDAAALLAFALPPAVMREVDPASFRAASESFVDAGLRDSYGDLLLEGRLARRAVLIYFLVEHKSRQRQLLPVDMYCYIADVWRSWRRSHPRARRVPGVLGVLISQAEGGWTRPLDLGAHLDVPDELARAAGPLLPGLKVAAFDRARTPDAVIERGPMRALARAALLLMKHVRREDLVRWIAQNGPLFREVAGEWGREGIKLLRSYTLGARSDVGDEAAKKIGEAAFGPEGWELIRSVEEDLRRKARREGLAEGRAEALLLLIEQRFGDVPEDVRERVRSADQSQLERWMRRIFDARSPADVVGDAP